MFEARSHDVTRRSPTSVDRHRGIHSKITAQLCAALGLCVVLSCGGLSTTARAAVSTKSDVVAVRQPSENNYKPAPTGLHADRNFDSAPLRATSGVTAVSGQIVTLDGNPIPNAIISDGALKTLSDQNGRYLLAQLKHGTSVLIINATHAGADSSEDYGYYEVQIVTTRGETLTLPYKNWLPKIDHTHEVSFPSPTTSEVVITNPALPGLEFRIPAGAVITGADHKVVTKAGITPIPVDRTPFPLPQNVKVPIYFTVQPGGAVITGVDGKWLGAHVWYPNFDHQLPNARASFFKYDAYQMGWSIYGTGRVSENQKHYIPDEGTRVYTLSSPMINAGFTPAPNPPPAPPRCTIQWWCSGGAGGSPGSPGHPGSSRPGGPGDPADGPPGPPPHAPPLPPCCGSSGGDPVDLASGYWTDATADLELKDTVSISLWRTYLAGDVNIRSFGVGMAMNYETYLWSANQYQEVDLIMPQGSRIHYVRTSPGTGYADAIFTASTTPGPYFNSKIAWSGSGWTLTQTDGTIYYFPEYAPLLYIQDRYGNRTSITRDGGPAGPVKSISSTNGRSITFTYTGSVVTKATDNNGRSVIYSYDGANRLQTVTNPDGGITTYSWDTTNNRITAVQRPRQNPSGPNQVTNQYDGNGRVHLQTLADGSVWQFDYTLGGSGQVVETDITDPNLHVQKVTFNSAGFWLTQKWAAGTPIEQDYTAVLGGTTPPAACVRNTPANSPPNRIIAETDPLGRLSCWTYDSGGQILTVTRCAGTAKEVTTSFTYGPFEQLAQISDPLSHTKTFGLDSLGRPTSMTDGVGNIYPIVANPDGTIASITNPLSNQTSYTYDRGDRSRITTPLGFAYSRYYDTVGQSALQFDPSKAIEQAVFDPIWGVSQRVDSNGNITTKSYNPDGRVSTFVDPRSTTGTPIKTTFDYDALDRLITRTDPLLHSETVNLYDGVGNIKSETDRKGQTAAYIYDELNRPVTATYSDGHVVAYTWDAANRLRQVQDTVSGVSNVIARTFDDLDCLTEEQVHQGATLIGTVDYTCDNAGRRATMTVSGLPIVHYTWDNANRIKTIKQGPATASFDYDAASRRHTLTLPNGTVATYTYDANSRLKQISYDNGATNVGVLTYDYNERGLATHRGGSLFTSALPAAVTSATYDVDNRLSNWAGTTIGYDLNGNLQNDGTNSYTWDARNRLTADAGATFAYDGLDRRQSISVSGVTTTSVFDDLSPLQDQSSGASGTTNLLTGPSVDERYTRAPTSGASSTYLVDQAGSTVALASSTGTVLTNYAYDPYGVSSSTGAANSNSYQFTGRPNDPTGLYYFRARYYNPVWGRFISEDPIGLEGGSNIYEYARDNPVGAMDPYGLWTFQVGGTITYNFWGVSLQANAGIAIDGEGNVGTYWSYPEGGAGTGSDAIGGISFAASNGTTICDLKGAFGNVSAGGGAGESLGGDAFVGQGTMGQPIVGFGVTAGLGVGAGAGYNVTSTVVHPW